MTRQCENPLCAADISERRRDAHFCKRSCTRQAKRLALRRKRSDEHPFCVVCGNPMRWLDVVGFQGKGNRRLSAVCCSAKCSMQRWHWLYRSAA